MQDKHFNIPIFIPNMGCPHMCVFCDQKKIAGKNSFPSSDKVISLINKHLSTIPKESKIEIAFFGGNFTGIPVDKQKEYLEIARSYVKEGRVSGIRLSTRPDYIDEKILTMLKEYCVTAVELGAQSMDDDVLKLSGRGHTAEDVKRASLMIKRAEISLGLQMMIGLPGDTLLKTAATARVIVRLGADTARIYPTLVIKGTELERLYLERKYMPLSLEEAVSWSSVVLQIFEEHNINVIRVGLHPSEGLLSGDFLAAGPFHASFRELVYTEIWRKLLERFLCLEESTELIIYVNPQEYKNAVGYNSTNKKMLLKKFKKVVFLEEPSLKGRYYGAKCN